MKDYTNHPLNHPMFKFFIFLAVAGIWSNVAAISNSTSSQIMYAIELFVSVLAYKEWVKHP